MIVVLAVDVPLALLTLGVVVLCVTTTATVLGLTPSMRRTRERPTSQLALPPGPPRRVITGRPVELSPAYLQPPPRLSIDPSTPVGESPDAPAAEVAEAAIIRMLDEHPDVIARVLATWLAQDDPHQGRP